jgi:hypothetical protein
MGWSERGLFSCLELQLWWPAPESIKDRSSGLVSKFDYVLAHMGFVGSHELSSLIGCQDKSEPTIPLGCTSG